MANEDKKDFNAMMNNKKNMPKIVHLDEEGAKKWGGKSMIVVPPTYYNDIIKTIPIKKVVTVSQIRKHIAKNNKVEITCPLTAGIFINICAWASYQRTEDKIPFWRVLKSNGELNPKYPGQIMFQKEMLEKEGHKIIVKGKKNIKYFVDNYEESLYELD